MFKGSFLDCCLKTHRHSILLSEAFYRFKCIQLNNVDFLKIVSIVYECTLVNLSLEIKKRVLHGTIILSS